MVTLKNAKDCRAQVRRHSIEVVLVAVVGLCTLENDCIHAAYLAVVLLLFRRRDALRLEGNRLFRLLSICNFAVMLMTLLYQAPVINKWGRPYGPELVRMSGQLLATEDGQSAELVALLSTARLASERHQVLCLTQCPAWTF